MDLDDLRKRLLEYPGAVEDLPFGPDVFVYKIGGRMFALTAWKETPLRINLKCDPDKALHLRFLYPSVLPGYHMNKTHWNTVILDGSVPDGDLDDMIRDSYRLVVQGLPKAEREKWRGKG
jgi:predicted DNA-binding protein (MmcQ/YjbR family)